ncbi:hypothetical protein N7457_003195 [Penicillium paradoxum]|uniref:uncharacterized protein n=1 Tax=Penicillium paradoxum TaxID=176176 RepID=UPI002549783D|nr:uncharacterized protein N7457_003195 [Penicillium paradoxum]KAJ5788205.1 hypothetical protein N7457_003195 [Penicillium paradoxum]
MAGVELAAVMSKLLQRHHIDAVPLAGKQPRGIEQTLEEVVNGGIMRMSLIMGGIYDAGKNRDIPMRLSR